MAFHITRAHEHSWKVPGAAALYLETTRTIALEGLDFEKAYKLALERVGTKPEQVVRLAKEFLDAWEARVSRDHFEGADAETIAELWGDRKGRFPSTLADLKELVWELREIIDRSPDNPERQELVEFFPGRSAKEAREILSRRRGR